jgi:CheY-like chemotaxis protein
VTPLVHSGAVSSAATRVLVVDDDDAIRALIAITLSVEGFEVIEAGDGWVALEILHSSHPDIVTIDVDMPPISGWEVVQQLRRDPRFGGIKVLLLSGHALDCDPARYEPLGVDACLRKPFDAHELVAAVTRLAG